MSRRRFRLNGFGIMRALASDVRASTLAMVAAALIPLTAMIGSGLDMARAYTVQARLQAACDAAALAGRRAMIHDKIETAVTDETTKFFNFNFPQGMYDTKPFRLAVTRPQAGTVHIEAHTRMKTAVMQLFGFPDLPANATCDASQNFINADVMLVLDVTGSMAETLPDGSTKIQALRDAVMSLYDQLKPTQDFLKDHGYRLRYGVVPYSQTVNVGRLLYAANPNYIRNPGTYSKISSYTCTKKSGKDCVEYNFSIQHSAGQTHDASWFAPSNTAWEGCIEERQTLVTAGATPTPEELADDRMKDLNIDLIPTSDTNSQWQPYDPSAHTMSIFGNACPAAAVPLQEWDRDSLLAYVNKLQPTGSTYHDIGMIWGAHMLSASGVFAASPNSFNGMRTNKYVVFLTDGEMAPTYTTYSAYGTEFTDRRITGGPQPATANTGNLGPSSDDNLVNRHVARFSYACNAVRNMPAQVWVIALNTALTDALTDCAHADGQAAVVSDKQGLIDKLAEIGKDISELRLSL